MHPVFDAVTALATDSAATPQVRVFAVRHLILLLQPNFLLTYAGLTRKADTTVTAQLVTWQEVGCVAQMGVSAPHRSLKGAPLPADYEARIRATLSCNRQLPDRTGGQSVTPRAVLPGWGDRSVDLPAGTAQSAQTLIPVALSVGLRLDKWPCESSHTPHVRIRPVVLVLQLIRASNSRSY